MIIKDKYIPSTHIHLSIAPNKVFAGQGSGPDMAVDDQDTPMATETATTNLQQMSYATLRRKYNSPCLQVYTDTADCDTAWNRPTR